MRVRHLADSLPGAPTLPHSIGLRKLLENYQLHWSLGKREYNWRMWCGWLAPYHGITVTLPFIYRGFWFVYFEHDSILNILAWYIIPTVLLSRAEKGKKEKVCISCKVLELELGTSGRSASQSGDGLVREGFIEYATERMIKGWW